MDISKQSAERISNITDMPRARQFEKIAMNIKNPQIYRQFLASEDSADVADYAYAAGLISKADADFIKQQTAEDTEEEDVQAEVGLGGN